MPDLAFSQYVSSENDVLFINFDQVPNNSYF